MAADPFHEQVIRKAVEQFYTRPSRPRFKNDGTHRQVHIEQGKHRADVDELIAPLITQLWNLNIDTFGSCQNVGEIVVTEVHHAYVSFFCEDDAQEFVAILSTEG